MSVQKTVCNVTENCDLEVDTLGISCLTQCPTVFLQLYIVALESYL